MKQLTSWLLFFSIILFVVSCSTNDGGVTTFILVRHAEKSDDGTKDPNLKPEGEIRARRLAAMLENAFLDALYGTDYKRSRNTLQPLSESKKLEVQIYEAFKPEVIEEMVERHRGRTIVVCGHSDNIPWTANLLVGEETYEEYKGE